MKVISNWPFASTDTKNLFLHKIVRTRLEVPFGKGNIYKIKRVLKSITPRGTTPIAGSLLKASSDFPACEDCRNIIILITDGVEACDGDLVLSVSDCRRKGLSSSRLSLVLVGRRFQKQL